MPSHQIHPYLMVGKTRNKCYMDNSKTKLKARYQFTLEFHKITEKHSLTFICKRKCYQQKTRFITDWNIVEKELVYEKFSNIQIPILVPLSRSYQTDMQQYIWYALVNRYKIFKRYWYHIRSDWCGMFGMHIRKFVQWYR